MATKRQVLLNKINAQCITFYFIIILRALHVFKTVQWSVSNVSFAGIQIYNSFSATTGLKV
jgi:hypothetical protein